MATIYLPNQPVSFINDIDTCAAPSAKYVQLVDLNDITQFQFKVSDCADSCTNKASDVTYGDGWDNTPAGACKSGLGTSDLEIALGTVGSTGLTYVTVTITSVTGTLQISISGLDAAETLGYITAPGTYTFYSNVSTGGASLIFHPVTEDSTACVTVEDTIVCDVPTNYIVQIRDIDGNFIATATDVVIEKNYFTYSINWADLGITSGCHTICIIDPCINTGGQFNNQLIDITPSETNSGSSGFYPNDNWLNFYYADSDEFGTGDLTYDITPISDCFNICFTISPASAGSRMKIVNGTFDSDWISSNGDHCVNIPNYDNTFPLVLSFESFYNDDAIYLMEIFNLTMNVCESAYTCDCCSVPLKIGSYDCTHVVKSFCDKDALGFKFCNTNFVPQIRLSSKLVRASYQTTRESFEDSAGNKNTIYFKRRRSKNFRVDPAVAEYVHDYLSTLSGYDHMYIDNHEYFVDDDEYQVSYPTRNDIEAIVSINVSEKLQLTENKNCGTTCDPGYEWPTTAKSCNC